MYQLKIVPARSRLNILRPICNYIPVHEVSKIARSTGAEAKSRTFNPWSHVVSLLYGQLTHSIGLNDLCDSLQLHTGPLASLRGATAPSRNGLLVVTHGGLNTTLESLSEGLPLVVVPITNDQPGVAARIAHLGVGEFIPVQKLTAAVMRQAVQRVLSTPSYRERSVHFAEKLRRLNGPARAADLIDNAFTNRQRTMRAQPAS
jgi:hypothetical protein